MESYYSNGKLLLTAEYVVLDGAKALAVPTKSGQSLQIIPIDEQKIQWESYDSSGKLWINCSFDLSLFFKNEKPSFKNPVVQRLFEILHEAHLQNPQKLQKNGSKVVSKLDFPNNWGLGSSSTLLNNIAQWFGIDAFLLLKNTFGGSGYDIACAQNNLPITYQLPQRDIKQVNFNPDFKDQLFFVHLNRKQNSREAISHYKNIAAKQKEVFIQEITSITEEILYCSSLSQFEKLINLHENLIGSITKQETVKNRLFPNYPHAIKSLGAWGGDFILAVGGEVDKHFFKNKKYHTIINYNDMVL